MSTRYVDETLLRPFKETRIKVSPNAFVPLGAHVIDNGTEKIMFYFEDIEIDSPTPKTWASVICLTTMDPIPNGYKYINTVTYMNRVIHLYVKT